MHGRIAPALLLLLSLTAAPLAAMPEDWTVLRTPELTLRLPAGWRQLPSAAGEDERRERTFQPADVPPGGLPMVYLSVDATGKMQVGGPDDVEAIEKEILEDLGPEVASDPLAYDPDRKLLWMNVRFRGKDRPLQGVLAMFLTETGSLHFLCVDEAAGYERSEETFRQVLGSVEIAESLRYREEPAASPSREELVALIGQLLGGGLRGQFSAWFFLLWIGVAALTGLAGGLVTAGSLVDAILLRGRLKAWLVGLLHRLALRRWATESRPAVRRRIPARWVPFPATIAFQLLLAAAVAFGSQSLVLRGAQVYAPGFQVLSTCAGYALLAAAGALHYLAGARRRLKYELIVAGLSAFIVGARVGTRLYEADLIGAPPAYVASYLFGFHMAPCHYLIAFGLLVAFWLRPGGEARSERRAEALYRLTHWAVSYPLLLGTLVVAAPTLGLPRDGRFAGAYENALMVWGFLYIVARYLAVERLLARPIVYLRSFHDHQTATVLGKIVMPVAFRYGPVVTAAHALQPPGELHRRTDFQRITRLVLLPDDGWQEWFRAVVARSRAVILDLSVVTGSVRWELDQAQALLPPERIAVLAREDALVPGLPEVRVIRYRLDRAGKKQARRELLSWLKALRAMEKGRPGQGNRFPGEGKGFPREGNLVSPGI